jgi:hypothetical protein
MLSLDGKIQLISEKLVKMTEFYAVLTYRFRFTASALK